MLFWARMCQFLPLSWIFFFSIGNLYWHVNFRLIHLWKLNMWSLPMFPSFLSQPCTWNYGPSLLQHMLHTHMNSHVYRSVPTPCLHLYHLDNLYLDVYMHFHANIQTTICYSNLKRNGTYLTHFVNLLSFCTSKQLKAQWCEAKWCTEEMWSSLVPRNYIVQIPVTGLVFWRGLGPCGCHQLLGLWHLTRGDVLWEQPFSRLYGVTVNSPTILLQIARAL